MVQTCQNEAILKIRVWLEFIFFWVFRLIENRKTGIAMKILKLNSLRTENQRLGQLVEERVQQQKAMYQLIQKRDFLKRDIQNLEKALIETNQLMQKRRNRIWDESSG